MRLFLIIGIKLFLITAAGAQLRFGMPEIWGEFSPNAATPTRVFGKLNRHGFKDLLFYDTNSGQVYVAFSTGRGFLPPKLVATRFPTNRPNAPLQILLADVNGDGFDDLIIFNKGADDVPGAATAVVAIFDINTGLFAPWRIWSPSFCASYQTCLAGDVNGDGKADIVAISQQFGTVFVALSQGGAFGENAIWNNYFCITNELCSIGDVNGDRRADLILFKPHAPGNQKGNVLIAHSTGAGFSNVTLGHGFFCIDQEQCMVADVNGDGKADIVLVKGFGGNHFEVLVSLSNGTQFINANPFLWANPIFEPTSSFYLADVTGDGKADLIQMGFDGQKLRIRVYPVTDKPPPPPPPPPPPGGVSSVLLYNCDPDQHQFYYWRLDQASGTLNLERGPVNAMYSETGYCPDPTDQPQQISMIDGHVQTLIVVDPDAIGCGSNDPQTLACVKHSASFRGRANGPACRWIISAQGEACVP